MKHGCGGVELHCTSFERHVRPPLNAISSYVLLYNPTFFCIFQLVKCAEEHLTLATKARSYMRGQVEKSRQEIERVFKEGENLDVPPIGSSPLPCSKSITIHFSFDFAQQVCCNENIRQQ